MTDLQGLSTAEVATRIERGQVNTGHQQTSRTLGDIIRANVFTRFNALLTVLLIVVLAVGSPADALFGIIIILNSGIGVVQELRAKRTLDRLAILNAPVAHVVRGGKQQEIAVTEVVLDDIIKLSVGDQVPADGQIMQTDGLEIDESLLTGESDAIAKQQKDKVLSGSIVAAGHGYMRATAVGTEAYAYKLAAQVKKFSRVRSELIEGTNKLLTYISWVIVVIAPLLVWGQLSHAGTPWQEALVRSTAAITGMIPEGLVLLTSLAFALAVMELARRKVLVQQLPAVEGLARVDVMCLDKTGTLTEGSIMFEELVPLSSRAEKEAPLVLATFAIEPDSPTLTALHEAFNTQKAHTTHGSVPFSSARKWSSITLEHESWVMGAPEMVDADESSELRTKAAKIAESGRRVLALLRSKTVPTAQELPKNMEPVALLVLGEKIRSDAAETLKFFSEQGVALKVISGDNPRTVGAIARAVGLEFTAPYDARNLPAGEKEFADIIESHTVFGRVTPEQKRAMVKALQSKGHVVAMTGDGVNDALALKDADIGVAMGNGAPATKATAELVLLDSKFAHLPMVLAEGRRVIANIERAANLFVVKNVYSLVLAVAVTIAALPFPFLPRHLTILSSLTIGIPAFFLGLAPNNQRYQPGFMGRVLRFAVPIGAAIAVLAFAAYFIAGQDQPGHASMLALMVVMVVGTWIVYVVSRPLNWWRSMLIAAMVGLFVLTIAVPFTRDLFQLEFVAGQLPLAIGVSAIGIIAVELLWRFSRPKTNSAPAQ
jgi:cation-transporting P-type ATPase E